jgi:hypothetical protein
MAKLRASTGDAEAAHDRALRALRQEYERAREACATSALWRGSRTRAECAMFSRTVSSRIIVSSCVTKPVTRRKALISSCMPFTCSVPAVRATLPMSTLRKVVLQQSDDECVYGWVDDSTQDQWAAECVVHVLLRDAVALGRGSVLTHDGVFVAVSLPRSQIQDAELFVY